MDAISRLVLANVELFCCKLGSFFNLPNPNLLKVFKNNTLYAVNGTVWPLMIEVIFYLFVPYTVIAFHKIGQLAVFISLYLA